MKKHIIVPDFDKRGGLITVVAQEAGTGEILMVAHTNRAGFFETLATGEAVYYSTSRQKRWKKGEKSGNTQTVHGMRIDCDGDAVIYAVNQNGSGACHTGKHSCFYRSVICSKPKPTSGDVVVEFVEVHPNFFKKF